MKSFPLTLLFIIFLASINFAAFGEIQKENDVLLKKILEISGVKPHLNRTPLLIQDQFIKLLKDNPSINKQTQEIITSYLLTILHPSILEQDIINHLQNSFSLEEKQQLFLFFNSTSYQDFKKLRDNSLRPQQKEALLAYHDKLKSYPVNSYRKQLMIAIDKASNQSFLETRINLHVHNSLTRLLNHLSIKTVPKDITDFEKKTLSHYQDIEETIHFYSYRTTPNSDLEHYIASLNEPLKQRFFSELNTAIEQSITERLNTTIELVE